MRANKSPEPTVVGAGSLSERSRVVGRFESTVAQLSTLGGFVTRSSMFIDSFNDAQVSSDAAGRVLVLMQHFAALCRFPVIRPDDGFVVSARPKHRRRFAFDSGHEEAFVAVPDIGFDYSVVIHIFVSVDHPPNKALETMTVGHRRCNWMS